MRILLLACCVACGSVDSKRMDAAVDVAGDGVAADAPGAACDVTKPFGTPALVPGVNGSGAERWGFLSSDELTIYFSDVAANREIYSATRAATADAFGTPAVLAAVNSGSDEEHPAVTGDGLILVADTNTFGASRDIGVATRTSTVSDFGALSQLAGINTANFGEADPWISADGKTLLFGSDRVGNEYRIYRSTRSSTTTSFGTPTEIAELNDTASVDSGAVLSADGLEIFFYSTRTGGSGQNDIWRATRLTPTGTFDPPTAVSELNTNNVEVTSWLSPDRCRIIFTSDRLGNYDLWMAARPR